MDELAIISRARWSPSNNEIVGFCDNHKNSIQSWKFNNFLKVKLIEKKFANQQIYLAKEVLVISICPMNVNDCIPKPVIMLPICCKKCDVLEEIIKTTIKKFEEINTFGCLLNNASDGDSYRRSKFDEMRETSKYDSVVVVVSQFKLFNSKIMVGKLSINYDVKHLIKRLRGILISDNRQICLLARSINKNHVLDLYPHLKHLLSPSDYQNVPAAVELLSNLKIDTCTKGDLSITIVKEIECFNKIIHAFLNIFVNPSINLFDQLIGLAVASHLLLFIYRKWKNNF